MNKKVIDIMKGILEREYDISLEVEYSSELKAGVLGCAQKLSKEKYKIQMAENIEIPDDWEILKIYSGIPKEIVIEHALVHEFCHIFDFCNEINTHHSPTIRENTVEYFAEYLAWLIILGNESLATDFADKYAHMRWPFFTEHARKGLRCAADVLFYRFGDEFSQITEIYQHAR
jgi:hypothetical protein